MNTINHKRALLILLLEQGGTVSINGKETKLDKTTQLEIAKILGFARMSIWEMKQKDSYKEVHARVV